MKEKNQNIVDSFQNLNALVIGDVMVDNYMWGNVNRISPEAPVPVVSISTKESRLGGAANVALNVQALGAIPILCSAVGNDENGKLFIELLKKNKLSTEGILRSGKRVTTVKTRVIAHNQQLLRVDEEEESNLNKLDTDHLYKKVEILIKKGKINVIIFEDYDKGILSEGLIQRIITLARSRKIPVAVDPKKKNFNHYQGATLFKPNFKELMEGTKSDVGSADISKIKNIAEEFRLKHGFEYLLLTLSDKGVFVFGESFQKLIPAHLRQIADVSGAGDTVISVAALCLATGSSIETIGALSNLAGGLVCEKIGVVPIEKDLLKAELKRMGF